MRGAHEACGGRITTVDKGTVFRDMEKKLTELKALFAKLAVEVQGEDFWR